MPAQKVEKRAVVYGDPGLRSCSSWRPGGQSEATVMVTGTRAKTARRCWSRYIHDHSNWQNRPSSPSTAPPFREHMLEATLFGYEGRAFTGAVGVPWQVRQAQGGTLLLDEITEMDLGLQAKLLRGLQEKEVERLGSRKMIPPMWVIATSNRDLKKSGAGRAVPRRSLLPPLNVSPALDGALGAPGDILPWRSICWRCMPARWGCRRRSSRPRAFDDHPGPATCSSTTWCSAPDDPLPQTASSFVGT